MNLIQLIGLFLVLLVSIVFLIPLAVKFIGIVTTTVLAMTLFVSLAWFLRPRQR